MTPKQKAKDLVENYAETIKPIEFGVILEIDWKSAKQCALIAVDEIINSRPAITDSQIEYQNYWQEVKSEIEKL
jgi:hypothetical protein